LNASFAAWQVGEICVKIEVASCCILCSIKELSKKEEKNGKEIKEELAASLLVLF